MTLTEKDSEILDYILKVVLSKGQIRVDVLKPLENDIYSGISSVKNSDYSFYIDTLVKDNLIKFNGWSDKTQIIERIPGRTQSFIDSGGYTELFKKNNLEQKINLNETRNTNINANQVIYNEQFNNGNQSLSDNVLESPIRQTTNIIIDKTPKRSWIELLSWIIGSIASMILIYEFIIKQLIENK